jgi:hypothetical protein
MNKVFGAAAFAIVLGLAIPAMAASDKDYKAKWD